MALGIADGPRINESAVQTAKVGNVAIVVPDRGRPTREKQKVSVAETFVLAFPREDEDALTPAEIQIAASFCPREAVDVNVLLAGGVVGQLEAGQRHVRQSRIDDLNVLPSRVARSIRD
jgi:hypothetical protein